MSQWDIQQSREIYNIAEWGEGYFDIDTDGHVVIVPDKASPQKTISLEDIILEIKQQGLSLPILLRFNFILKARIERLQQAFSKAMACCQYQGNYQIAYPIKVNQQRRVIQEILRHGHGEVGLEAGSKPELLAILALSPSNQGLILCNGYKDRKYIRLALIARKLGRNIKIIIEKSYELDLVIAEATKIGVVPQLGIRARLSSLGAGQWQNSGGEKSKFGLTASQILDIVEKLTQIDCLHWIELLHFHMGSQIANIRDIQQGLQEASQFYYQLHQLGVNINTVDVGGGLGVDYEGTQSKNYCSMNYSIDEYAEKIIQIFHDVCTQHGLKHPNIITESGRALTAHHAMLVTDVVNVETVDEQLSTTQLEEFDHPVLQDLSNILHKLERRTLVTAYHDAYYSSNEVKSLFSHGVIRLEQRAKAEQLYTKICCKIRDLVDIKQRSHREILDDLNEKLSDKVFCNFSLFQSMPDIWAIDQIFPIMPLSGLEREPTRRGVIHDTTCDSDGSITSFVDGQGIETTLPLQKFNPDKPYFIGMFLLGAYQEILGDMHNLFGDTDSVHVEITPEGGFSLHAPLKGDQVSDVLQYVHFQKEELIISYRQQFEQVGDAEGYLNEIIQGLEADTYLVGG